VTKKVVGVFVRFSCRFSGTFIFDGDGDTGLVIDLDGITSGNPPDELVEPIRYQSSNFQPVEHSPVFPCFAAGTLVERTTARLAVGR
jgi:hypothetical protein